MDDGDLSAFLANRVFLKMISYDMNKLLFKRIFGTLYPPQFDHRKIILIYHAVGDSPWALKSEKFLAQMQWLKNNTDVVSLAHLLFESSSQNRIQVAITFDDGYACLRDIVSPIFSELKICTTVYINTGMMSDDMHSRKNSDAALGHYPDEQFLSWEDVKILDQVGWMIGSHGVNHIDLTAQPESVIIGELSQSKKHVEEKLQKPCEHFAYTWAKYSPIVQQHVKKVGYRTAVAGHHMPLHGNSDFFALPRLNIQSDYSQKDFEGIVTGKWDFMTVVQRVKKILK